MKQGKVIFLTGVSGAGKTTMMDLLLTEGWLHKICSVTTRSPREGEVNGDHYVFVDQQEFERLIQEGKMLEYVFVHQIAYYGTRIDWIQDALKEGKSLVKTIDMIGMQIIEREKKLDPSQYVCIFLDIPTEIMKGRILQRQPNIDSLELQKRLDSAYIEKQIAYDLQHRIIIDGSASVDEVFADIKQVLSDVIG